MILEFLPHRACDSILPTLMSVSLQAEHLLCTIIALGNMDVRHAEHVKTLISCHAFSFLSHIWIVSACVCRRRQMPRRT